jgi:hydroxymethylpyrimidine/phosphomethylpyrimidine kinase
MKCVLTIAGSDSGGGAGIQADLKVFATLGVFGTSAITAVTAQNTVGVRRVDVLEPDAVRAQIDAVVEDFAVAAVKTGMLANAPIIREVARALDDHGLRPVVIDPVCVAGSGDPLLARRTSRKRPFWWAGNRRARPTRSSPRRQGSFSPWVRARFC